MEAFQHLHLLKLGGILGKNMKDEKWLTKEHNKESVLWKLVRPQISFKKLNYRCLGCVPVL